MTALRIEHATLGLRAGPTLFRDLSVTVKPGEVLRVMGPSGCGKSTLLAFIGGFLDLSIFAASGAVWIGDELISDLPPEERHVGILFQDPVLFPHLSVGANLMLGLPRDKAKTREARRDIVAATLAEAGLDGFIDRDPSGLSGGQRARAALLRTILSEPRALLLDEPFNKLDTPLRTEFRQLIFRTARERGLPTLLVTHDPADGADTGAVINLGGLS